MIKPIYEVLYEKASKHEYFSEKPTSEVKEILIKKAWEVATDDESANGYVHGLYQLVGQ